MKKIKLPNQKINVNFVPSKEINKKSGKNFFAYGLYKSHDGEILINNSVSKDIQRMALMHELIHACDIGGIKPLTETQVEFLTQQMLYLLRNNKGVLDWLRKE
jgi:hypothetical protein